MSDNIVVDGSSGDVFVFVEMVIGYDELSSEHFEKFETPKTRENFENIDKLQKNNTVPGSIQYHKLKIQSHQITVKMILQWRTTTKYLQWIFFSLSTFNIYLNDHHN